MSDKVEPLTEKKLYMLKMLWLEDFSPHAMRLWLECYFMVYVPRYQIDQALKKMLRNGEIEPRKRK